MLFRTPRQYHMTMKKAFYLTKQKGNAFQKPRLKIFSIKKKIFSIKIFLKYCDLYIITKKYTFEFSSP